MYGSYYNDGTFISYDAANKEFGRGTYRTESFSNDKASYTRNKWISGPLKGRVQCCTSSISADYKSMGCYVFMEQGQDCDKGSYPECTPQFNASNGWYSSSPLNEIKKCVIGYKIKTM